MQNILCGGASVQGDRRLLNSIIPVIVDGSKFWAVDMVFTMIAQSLDLLTGNGSEKRLTAIPSFYSSVILQKSSTNHGTGWC